MAKSKKQESGSEVVSGMAEMESDKDGNTFLPGTAPIVIAELVESAKRIELELKPEFSSARDALVEEQDNLKDLAHKHISHFSEADDTGKRTYKAGGVEISLTFEKEKILTKLEKKKEVEE
jgi:hypothetical protein